MVRAFRCGARARFANCLVEKFSEIIDETDRPLIAQQPAARREGKLA